VGHTLDTLAVRVAEYLGIADQSGSAFAVPTDAKDYELCKRIVNDGLKRFYSSHPKGRWFFLEPTISLTLSATGNPTANPDSDPSRYYLPDGVMGAPNSPWTYSVTGPRKRIDTVDEAIIRELIANSGSTSGDPIFVCHRPLETTSNSQAAQKWEAVFWPIPTSNSQIIQSKVRLFPPELTDGLAVPIGSPIYDDAILAACMAEAEKKVDDSMGIHNPYFEKVAVPKAVMIDSQLTPRTLGSTGNGDRRSWYSGVDTYNNVPT
jgi:hypothetical protein